MSKKRSKKRRKGVLQDHRKVRGKLVPPLAQLPLSPISWLDDSLPEFIWIGEMLGRRTDWKAASTALDLLDPFVPDGPRVLDGTITSFSLVPVGSRPAARDLLRLQAPHAVPVSLGHALRLYPECPAAWLFDDHAACREPDAEIGADLLRTFIQEHADSRSVPATRLRLLAIVRLAKHGLFHFQRGSALELVPKYPGGLSTADQAMLESVIRASWSALLGADQAQHDDLDSWSSAFWHRNRGLWPCRTSVPSNETPATVEMEDGEIDPEPLMQLSEMRDVLATLDVLGDRLRVLQMEGEMPPDSDSSRAVLLGLASRLFRLFYVMAERPSAWTSGAAVLHLRPIVDARILSAWLIKSNDPSLFEAYREFGQGRLKLLQAHAEADLADIDDRDAEEFLTELERRVNMETRDWVQSVDLSASFANVSHRAMAEEADLKRDYDLAFAPLSGELHGDWPAVRDLDTALCIEPMHGIHRVGTFAPSSRFVSPRPLELAFGWVAAGISDIFSFLELDTDDLFEPLRVSLDEALHERREGMDGSDR